MKTYVYPEMKTEPPRFKWVFALYVDDEFLRYFDSEDDARAYGTLLEAREHFNQMEH